MELLPQTQTSAAAARSALSSTTGTISADFQTFLRMLTTQMQNQDPLNPMDSTEFASQLAQFSGVEQQVRTNDLLSGMQAGLATLGMAELGGWIGMEARAQMPVTFTGEAVTVAGNPDVLADRMELIVRDANGQIVQQVPVPLTAGRFDWTGRDLSGNSVPPGVYGLSIQSWSGEDLLDEQGAMVFATVEEARMVDNQVWLTTAGGSEIPASAVLGLRRPS